MVLKSWTIPVYQQEIKELKEKLYEYLSHLRQKESILPRQLLTQIDHCGN